jgi:hypothetical protein
MIETIFLTLFWYSFVVAIDDWLRKKREILFVLSCGVVPAALHMSGLSWPVAVAIAILLAIPPLVTAFRRDRPYGKKLLYIALPAIILYLIFGAISAYMSY